MFISGWAYHKNASTDTTWFQKRKTSSIGMVNEAIINLKRAMNNNDDEFQQFGNHIAAQLGQLPLENALLLQENIQRLITRERISCMASSSRMHVQIPQMSYIRQNQQRRVINPIWKTETFFRKPFSFQLIQKT
jgi:hypothetical protein